MKGDRPRRGHGDGRKVRRRPRTHTPAVPKRSDPPMSKPTAAPIDPKQLVELAAAVVRADRFPDLATLDGDQPRVRPVSPVRTDHFTVYVANLRSYHKTAEIAANPKVELCYLADNHDQVRITGVAEIVRDRAVLQQIWDANPL